MLYEKVQELEDQLSSKAKENIHLNIENEKNVSEVNRLSMVN